MKKLLVTGLNGFVGMHVQALLAHDPSPWQLLASQPHDLLDPASLDEWLEAECPDVVLHLAGQTFVPESFRDPHRTLQVNFLGTLNLLQALKRRGFSGSFLYVSSGDVYCQVGEDGLPITESLAPNTRNPYAVSEVAAELLCQQWSYTEPWRIMIARPFNHIGTGQGDAFVIPGMARQLIRIRKGLRSAQLEVGDVDETRDFLGMRNVIRAYMALLEQGCSGEIYNICSGVECQVRDLIMQMVGLAGVEGWAPGISITETLKGVLSDCEARETNHV